MTPIIRQCAACFAVVAGKGSEWQWSHDDIPKVKPHYHPFAALTPSEVWLKIPGMKLLSGASHGYCGSCAFDAMSAIPGRAVEADKTVPAHSPGKIYLIVGGKS